MSISFITRMWRQWITGALLVLLSAGMAQANVWIVDNQEHRPADFRSIQAANDSEDVEHGDTLMIKGSSRVYSGRTLLSKRLNLIGTGYYHERHGITSAGIPGDEVVDIEQLVFNVKFVPNTRVVESSSAGAQIIGLRISGTTKDSNGNSIEIRVSDVLIERCHLIGDIRTAHVDGVDNQPVDQVRNLIVLNSLLTNVFLRAGRDHRFESSAISTWQSSYRNTFLNHCSITVGRTSTGIPLDIENCTIENCIIQAHGNNSGANFKSTVARGNLFLPLREGEFSNVPTPDSNTIARVQEYNDAIHRQESWPNYWRLKPDGIAIGVGVNGVDPGFFSGPRPYILAGLPPIPRIVEIRVPTVVSQQSGLPLRIEAEVRQ